MKTEVRMDKPEDALAKRQAAYACDVIHEFHNLPGNYLQPGVNELPDAKNSVPRVDSAYVVEIDDEKYVVNREDESSRIDDGTFKKINKYRINLEYATKMPVISVITTPVDMGCEGIYIDLSPTLTMHPIVISYPNWDGQKRLSKITSKINHNDVLTCVEGMDLVMIPRMFVRNHEEILEKVCHLLSRAKIEDDDFKLELIFEMRCIIHKYAKTLKDINKLEEVIGLQKVITAREFQDNLLIEQGIEQGIEKGIEQGIEQGIEKGIEQGIERGNFEMALKIRDNFGIDEALRLSSFSREELESGKLDR